MARRFTEAGLTSECVTADTDSDARKRAISSLENGSLRAVFAVDLFNEGVDIPSVDTLLLLRPTESALVFMQQLGRGLRRFENKDCVTVLDFIGQSHRKFRFDLRYRAITGGTRSEVEKQIELGFPLLPAGCSMQLDKVASKIVLENLKSAIPSARPAMVRELKALMDSDQYRGRPISLASFLSETGLELSDVYRNGCWSALKRQAGLTVPQPGPKEELIGGAMERLLHIDDPLRIDGYRRWLSGAPDTPINERDSRIVVGLPATIWAAKLPAALSEALIVLQSHPAIVDELHELLVVLESEADHLTSPLPDLPLSVHARHSLAEVFAAIGRITPGHFYQHREGVYYDRSINTDLFFVTLEKSDRDYSPSTLYKDYAISPSQFHWESQSITSESSASGQRYIHHRERGSGVLLFVRQRIKENGRTVPYTLLGPVDYVSHQHERPIQFVWQLRQPMPADFFRQAKVATA